MISPTLNVGDKFTDGHRTFVVEAVVGKGVYISKCIGVNVPKEIVETPVKVVDDNPETDEFGKAYTRTEINRMPKDKLEILSKELGLEIGTTSEMKKAILEKLSL